MAEQSSQVAQNKIVCGGAFGRAFCAHFGLPTSKVFEIQLVADPDAVFTASLSIAITAADLASIAEHMAKE